MINLDSFFNNAGHNKYSKVLEIVQNLGIFFINLALDMFNKKITTLTFEHFFVIIILKWLK